MNRKIAVNRVVGLADCTTAPMHHIEREQQVIDQALAILTSRLKERSKAFYNASMVKAFLRLQLEPKEREHFSVMFLDAQHRLIDYQVLFIGTIDSTTVSPRDIIKAALQLNAHSLIVAHNHPSGVATPSEHDISFTKQLISALQLVGIKLLDHLVIGHNEIVSIS